MAAKKTVKKSVPAKKTITPIIGDSGLIRPLLDKILNFKFDVEKNLLTFRTARMAYIGHIYGGVDDNGEEIFEYEEGEFRDVPPLDISIQLGANSVILSSVVKINFIYPLDVPRLIKKAQELEDCSHQREYRRIQDEVFILVDESNLLSSHIQTHLDDCFMGSECSIIDHPDAYAKILEKEGVNNNWLYNNPCKRNLVSMCWGSYEDPLKAAYKAGDIFSLMYLFIAFLREFDQEDLEPECDRNDGKIIYDLGAFIKE